MSLTSHHSAVPPPSSHSLRLPCCADGGTLSFGDKWSVSVVSLDSRIPTSPTMRRHHSRQPLATSDSACTKYVGKWIAGPHLLSSQCCEEAPDALHRKLQSEPGPCCLGSRMLVSAASHTPAESRDHPSWHYLRVVVDNMWQVRQTMGVAVDLIVAVTAKPPRLITSAPQVALRQERKALPARGVQPTGDALQHVCPARSGSAGV